MLKQRTGRRGEVDRAIALLRSDDTSVHKALTQWPVLSLNEKTILLMKRGKREPDQKIISKALRDPNEDVRRLVLEQPLKIKSRMLRRSVLKDRSWSVRAALLEREAARYGPEKIKKRGIVRRMVDDHALFIAERALAILREKGIIDRGEAKDIGKRLLDRADNGDYSKLEL